LREGEKSVIKILLVDDHPVFRRGLVYVLKDWPDLHVVGEAANGVEAISRATELQPDVVIMDLRMPGVNGAEATAALQQVVPQAKVLILTVSDESEDLFACMEAGARGYLLKSAELDGLVAAIRVVATGDVIITPGMATRLLNELKQGARRQSQAPAPVATMSSDDSSDALSLREKQVMQLVVQGASNKEIAAKLFISETTVKAHLRTILEKLQVKNRAEAVAKATAKGLLR
jgi:two-component system NarL family response regulator